MNKRMWVLGIVIAVLVVAVAVLVTLLLTDDDSDTAVSAASQEPTTTAVGGAQQPGGGAAGGGSAGGSGGGGGGGAGDQSGGNREPYIRDDLQVDTGYPSDEDPSKLVPWARIDGKALDDDSPDSQGRVSRVEVEWGDGTKSDAVLGGHGAFSAYHDYAASYAGQTVTIKATAYDDKGSTASKSVTTTLPKM